MTEPSRMCYDETMFVPGDVVVVVRPTWFWVEHEFANHGFMICTDIQSLIIGVIEPSQQNYQVYTRALVLVGGDRVGWTYVHNLARFDDVSG